MTVEVISDVGLGKVSRFVSWQSERQTNRRIALFFPEFFSTREKSASKFHSHGKLKFVRKMNVAIRSDK